MLDSYWSTTSPSDPTKCMQPFSPGDGYRLSVLKHFSLFDLLSDRNCVYPNIQREFFYSSPEKSVFVLKLGKNLNELSICIFLKI
jgi:hypothetical protein